MEALNYLVTQIPDWIKRLDDLTGQIDKRQLALAQHAAAAESPSFGARPPSAAKSVRNRGSTESLKPQDEPPAYGPGARTTTPPAAVPGGNVAGAGGRGGEPGKQHHQEPPSSPSESNTPSALVRQADRMRAAGQARMRQTMRKRVRSESVISAEGQGIKYRSRSMIIVYYDSYVQSFFEELVKFVSAGRNMMRKAKMAAKVAQIRRMAEIDPPDDEDMGDDVKPLVAASPASPSPIPTPPAGGSDPFVLAAAPSTSHPSSATNPAAIPSALSAVAGGPKPGAPDTAIKADSIGAIEASASLDDDEPLPVLKFRSTRNMGPRIASTHGSRGAGVAARSRVGLPSAIRSPYSRMSGFQLAQQPDVYDELDKGLEEVQSLCEHAAHQFLRDGECPEDVTKIGKRMAETKVLADGEMERVKKNGASVPGDDDALKGRRYKPATMRREFSSTKDTSAHSKAVGVTAKLAELQPTTKLAAAPDLLPTLAANDRIEADSLIKANGAIAIDPDGKLEAADDDDEAELDMLKARLASTRAARMAR